MKNRRSFKRVIIHRFIGYTIGIALTLLVLEFLFSLYTLNNGMNLSELASSPLGEGTESLQITLSVFWNLITAGVYLIGIVLLGAESTRESWNPFRKWKKASRQLPPATWTLY